MANSGSMVVIGYRNFEIEMRVLKMKWIMDDTMQITIKSEKALFEAYPRITV